VELMTLEEAAVFLRKSPAQMRWMRHAGTGPRSAKVGGRVMFRKADVLAWIDAQFEAEAG
jgi:predicted DNA-binding transcriptional regulator AlpA